jgi:hypothetical protein
MTVSKWVCDATCCSSSAMKQVVMHRHACNAYHQPRAKGSPARLLTNGEGTRRMLRRRRQRIDQRERNGKSIL